MEISIPVTSILQKVTPIKVEGAAERADATGVATLREAKTGDVSFINSAKFVDQLHNSQAMVVLLEDGIEATPREGQLFVWVKRSSLEMARVCEAIVERMWQRPAPGVHPSACIDPTASVDANATIGPFVTIETGARVDAGCVIGAGSYIGADCSIGADSWFFSRVTLERDTQVGQRVRLHSGVVLGADGFGYEFDQGRHQKIPQVGYVIVEDDVEIGANSTVDRGRFGPTRIGEGTKIDNLVQVGHNVIIGKHCILCSQVGLSGSTIVGNYVVMGGRVGTAGHLAIGDGAQLAALTAVYSDLEGGKKWGGAPAVPLVTFQRIQALTRRMPDLFKRMNQLESQLGKLGKE